METASDMSDLFTLEEEGIEVVALHTVWEQVLHAIDATGIMVYKTQLSAVLAIVVFATLYSWLARKLMQRDTKRELQYVHSLGFKDRAAYDEAMKRNMSAAAHEEKKGDRQQDMWADGPT